MGVSTAKITYTCDCCGLTADANNETVMPDGMTPFNIPGVDGVILCKTNGCAQAAGQRFANFLAAFKAGHQSSNTPHPGSGKISI